MPGASLWLVPREDNPFTKAVQELISDSVPSAFGSSLEKHKFIPHVTLTSDIDPDKTYNVSGKSPQQWLDELDLPEYKKEFNEVNLELDHLEAGDPMFRKLVIEINQQDNLTQLAARCRREGVLGSSEEAAAQRWAKTEYAPHFSLLYADLPKDEVKKKIGYIELQIGWAFGSLFDCCGGTLCLGGDIVLVDTTKPISEWQPIARRETPWVMWKMSRNLA